MLAYRHQFHAGNFADVFKHALLVRLLLALTRKEKPLCYVDTHAGVGLYDLTHAWALKNAEFRVGIERVWQREDHPDVLAPYLTAVRAANPDRNLRFYPGSAWLAQRFLRPDDRMVLSELNATDCAALTQRFASDRRVAVQHMDGYQALKAYLPPPERRGLAFVDSAFDRAGEFRRLVAALATAYDRWATGVYALWYPFMERATMRAFERDLIATGIRKVLQVELAVRPEGGADGLRGCGLVVANPPYGFADESETVAAWLEQALAMPSDMGEHRVHWLVPE